EREPAFYVLRKPIMCCKRWLPCFFHRGICCGMMIFRSNPDGNKRMNGMVYLDNSATTQPDPEVIRVMSDVMRDIYGNPSSLHGLGGKAERLLKQARETVARILGVSPQSLVFTSGGT